MHWYLLLHETENVFSQSIKSAETIQTLQKRRMENQWTRFRLEHNDPQKQEQK